MVSTMPIAREQLIERASALVPRLRERAAMTEQLRRLPNETIADLADAGLLRMANPDRFGGFGLDFDAKIEVTLVLGRACGSAAWCHSILTTANWMVGLWPEPAQHEFFAASPDTFGCSSLEPGRSQVEIVSGGYRLSGRWSFASGCDAATWAIVGGLCQGTLLFFLVPMADLTIVDNWFVSGMRGTGSKDLAIDNVFVPRHRVANGLLMKEGQTDGWALHGRPSYRVPQFALMPLTLVSPIIGMAQGAVETFAEQLHGRLSPDREPLIRSVPRQINLAESSAEVDAARSLIRQNVGEVLGRGARGEALTLMERARHRRDYVFAARLAVRAVSRVFEAGGGHALLDSNPLQRFHRDALAAAQHQGVRWDDHAEQYGRVALGFEPSPSARL